MIERIWCTRRSWPSRLSDTTVSWGGNGGLEFSDPLPPPTEAGNRRQNGGIVSEPGPGTWVRKAGNGLGAPGAMGGSVPWNVTPSPSLAANNSRAGRPGRQGGGVGCKMAAGGRASPGAGEGEEMAGAVSERATLMGASVTALGCGEQLGGVMGEAAPATWEGAKTGSCSAGAFQGNMAGGGGGFSPEAPCGAAAVESHKGEPMRAMGFLRPEVGDSPG
ncbi:uncharacterized protein LOC116458286 [Hylobates moloch]|uniref:uncharacterized protein LOC116458286 n=1 Tax=Hylobates moloch TaxID=81572 RepID=UPI00136479C7|nr:uncharacterized protein LOC116458286 [Hylobates moloch]